MGFRIETVDAPLTYELRQAVLRPHLSLEEIAAQDVQALTFAARRNGGNEVLSSASLLEEQAPDVVPDLARQQRRSYRLRNMATRPDCRGRGVGTAVLQSLVDYLAARGGGLLWCNARESASSFYDRAGFVVAGGRFIEEDLGPHFVMWRLVPPDDEPAAAGSRRSGAPPR